MTPKEVYSVIEDCRNRRIPVLIGSQGLDVSFQTIIHQIEGNELIIENRVLPEFIRKFSSGPKFFLQCKMLRLQTSKVSPNASNMSFLIQENSVIEETRQSERFMFSAEERVSAEFTNPFDNSTTIRRTVMDLSASGLSLRMNVGSKLFEPGTKIKDLKVQIDQKPYSKNAAEVVYRRKFMTLGGKLQFQVGFKFV